MKRPTGPHELRSRVYEKLRCRVPTNSKTRALIIPSPFLGKQGRKSRNVYEIVGLLYILYTNNSAPRKRPTGPHELQARVYEKLKCRVLTNSKTRALIIPSIIPSHFLGKQGQKSRCVYKIVGLSYILYTNNSAPRKRPPGPHEPQARVEEKLRCRVLVNSKTRSLIFTKPSHGQAKAKVTRYV